MNRSSFCIRPGSDILSVLYGKPQAVANITGSMNYPTLSGAVRLYQTHPGVIVLTEVHGMPQSDRPCQKRIFGFHIHEGTNCGGDMDDPFADTMGHYNPNGCEHPYHAGDLPPLFGNNGIAISLFLTNQFSVNEVIGKTIVIHDHPDDFLTQPSGNSGIKIACGVIGRITGHCL